MYAPAFMANVAGGVTVVAFAVGDEISVMRSQLNQRRVQNSTLFFMMPFVAEDERGMRTDEGHEVGCSDEDMRECKTSIRFIRLRWAQGLPP